MRNSYFTWSALAVLLVVGTHCFAANGSLQGVVTDNMCMSKHTMMPGKPDSDCVRACVKAGSKYALLVGDKVYKVEDTADQLDKFAGRKAKVTGDLSGDTIRAVTVGPSQ